ncbi:uncharacterized protein TrAtP1_003041 [Trichoderma atroviride]|uniref:uncharacterized protein n=1 Tax=Hypocrea atroviridis TaxID=63577 RepID=UPI00331F759B|nr:hypothetical protein TrAtP1_003041 [Trichoderma atroviride]
MCYSRILVEQLDYQSERLRFKSHSLEPTRNIARNIYHFEDTFNLQESRAHSWQLQYLGSSERYAAIKRQCHATYSQDNEYHGQ